MGLVVVDVDVESPIVGAMSDLVFVELGRMVAEDRVGVVIGIVPFSSRVVSPPNILTDAISK